MSFTLGSDPELLLVNKTGKLISAVDLIGGSKEEPKKTTNGYVQEDNVLVEFNSNPAGSEKEFITNIGLVLHDIEDIIKPLDLSLKIESSGLFDEDQLNNYKALLAGCEPDYNAWTKEENESPILATTNLRSCGGHLHIAFDRAEEEEDSRFELVKIMDLVAGVPSILMDRDVHRRTLYGKAGACRTKYTAEEDAYNGVEYRVLSNFWLRNEQTIGWAYRAVERAVNNFSNLKEVVSARGDEIVQCINHADEALANQLVKEFNLEVCHA